jgi:hypothetical protein
MSERLCSPGTLPRLGVSTFAQHVSVRMGVSFTRKAVVSGAVKLRNLSWTPYTLPAGRASGTKWVANAYVVRLVLHERTSSVGTKCEGVARILCVCVCANRKSL